MAADTYDLTIDQGRDWYWTIWWKVGRTKKLAVVKPGIETYRIEMGLKHEYEDTVPVLLISTDDHISFGSDGSIQFYIPAIVTATLPPLKFKYEVVSYSPDVVPIKKSLGKGPITVSPAVV